MQWLHIQLQVAQCLKLSRLWGDIMTTYICGCPELEKCWRASKHCAGSAFCSCHQQQSSCRARILQSGSVVFPLFEEVLQQRHGRSYWGQGKPWCWLRTRNTIQVSLVWPWILHRESQDPRSSRLKARPHWAPNAHWTGSNLVWARPHWMRIRPIRIRSGLIPIHFQRWFRSGLNWIAQLRLAREDQKGRGMHAHRQWARFSRLHTVFHVSAQLEKQYDGWLK